MGIEKEVGVGIATLSGEGRGAPGCCVEGARVGGCPGVADSPLHESAMLQRARSAARASGLGKVVFPWCGDLRMTRQSDFQISSPLKKPLRYL